MTNSLCRSCSSFYSLKPTMCFQSEFSIIYAFQSRDYLSHDPLPSQDKSPYYSAASFRLMYASQIDPKAALCFAACNEFEIRQ